MMLVEGDGSKQKVGIYIVELMWLFWYGIEVILY